MSNAYSTGERCGMMVKQAIETGFGGYLSAPLGFSAHRAAEVKGARKMRGEDADSVFIRRPVLSHLLAQLVGAGGGALLGGTGAALAGVRSPEDVGVGAGMGAGAGAVTAALLSPFLQQRAVARSLEDIEDDDPEMGKRLRRHDYKPKQEARRAEKRDKQKASK